MPGSIGVGMANIVVPVVPLKELFERQKRREAGQDPQVGIDPAV
jgi:hypothetical protein